VSKELGTPMAYVFIPHSPSPISGMLVLVPRSDVKQTTMTVEEGFRLIVSCGVLSNPTPSEKPVPPGEIPSNGHSHLPVALEAALAADPHQPPSTA